jgi:hypothetical protein
MGLIRLDINDSSSKSVIIPLSCGNVLGRNPQGPKSKSNHIDLGITKANGGEVISRKLLGVMENSKGKLQLQVWSSTNATKAVTKYQRGDEVSDVLPGSHLTLLAGDVLIIHKRHRFRVVPCATKPTPNTTKKGKENAAWTATTTNKTSEAPASKKDTSKKQKLSRSKNKAADEATDYHVDSNSRIVLPSGMQPFRPTRTWGVETPTFQPPKNETTTSNKRPATMKPKDGDDSDDEDDDDEGPKDMHVSLANTYWKALNSASPHIGANFFHTLLATGKLPPLRLCGDLIQLLTFGPQTCGHAFYDGNRLQLAFQFLQCLVAKYPDVMYERLTQAAGPDYWKTILDQLLTLPYKENLDDSLQMHGFSLKLLELLLLSSSSSSPSSPLLQHIQEYGGKAACKVAANAMAHVWIRYGHYIWEGTNSSLKAVTCQLTRSLTRIVSCLLQQFVNNDKEAMDILWNAMDGKIRSNQEPTTKPWKQKVKLYWVCSLEEDNKYTQTLLKRVGVQKEYAQMMGR